jgi:hypothetical protein
VEEKDIAVRGSGGERGKTCCMGEVKGRCLLFQFCGIGYIFGIAWIVTSCYDQ